MLSERLEQVCRAFSERVAFLPRESPPVTYRNFFFTVVAFAERLRDAGIEAGDHVTVELDEPLAATALRLALLRLGATIVPPRGKNTTQFRIDCRLVSEGPSNPGEPAILCVDESWVRSPSDYVPVTSGGRVVKATSGTTGEPKLRVSDELGLFARVDPETSERRIAEGPVLIAYNPSSSAGFNSILRVMFAGVAQLHAGAVPVETLRAAAEVGASMALVPAAKLAWLVEAGRTLQTRPSFSRIQAGGGAISPALAREAEALFGGEVINSYGSSETGSISHFRPATTPVPGVVGRIYAHLDYRFEDENGQEIAPDTGGELLLHVPADRQVLTFPDGRPICDAGGWIRTGDIGRILPDGSLRLEGRVHDLINLGGNKRSPALLEAAISGLVGMADAVVFSVVNAQGIDEVGVAVVGAGHIDAQAVREILAKDFAIHSPVHLFAVDEIPLTKAGKIDRRALARNYSLPSIIAVPQNGTDYSQETKC